MVFSVHPLGVYLEANELSRHRDEDDDDSRRRATRQYLVFLALQTTGGRHRLAQNIAATDMCRAE